MRDLGPEFIDITWFVLRQDIQSKEAIADVNCRGAGGKNADLTNSLVQVCQATIGIETCMHLCCTESAYYLSHSLSSLTFL